jgi:hypothetical protein
MNPLPTVPVATGTLAVDRLQQLLRDDPAFRADAARLLQRLLAPAPESVSPSAIVALADSPLLSALVETYKSKLDSDVRSGELSMLNCNRQKTSLRAMLKHMPDVTLAALDYSWLSSVVSKMKDRATNGHAPDTIQTNVRDVRTFFGWLEDTGSWRPGFNLDKLCRVRKQKLFTLPELKQRAHGQKVFTPEELATLYHHASRTQRLYLLLGLNLAATQGQIADLVMTDLHLGDDPPYIEFVRSKTRHCAAGTVGHYELWPETAALLRARVARTPKTEEGWAILTKDRQRMVRYNERGGRCDPILMSWKKLLDKSKLPADRRLSFKYLRKTIADMVLRRSDEQTQQQMLAHARKTIAAKHYSGRQDFTQLSETLRTVRSALLQEMFVVTHASKHIAQDDLVVPDRTRSGGPH